jgi:hypothetical protein
MTATDGLPLLNRRERSTTIAMSAAIVAGLGGLLRLAAEAVFAILSAIAPSQADRSTVTFAAISAAVAAVIAFGLWRWPWYRGIIRQTRGDVRKLFASPTEPAPPPEPAPRAGYATAAIVVLLAALVAALLPGVVAAAVAVVIGLVVRVAVAAATATSDIRPR